MRKSPLRARLRRTRHPAPPVQRAAPRPRSGSWTSNASTPSARASPTSPSAPPRSGGIFDYDRKSHRLTEVNATMENPAIWDDPKRAQELGREKRSLEQVVATIDHLTTNLTDNAELYEMVKEEGDVDSLQQIEADAAKLQETVEGLEFRRMFSNPADPLNCFIDIQAGAGGTEACDWAGMLLRQYLKYAERKGFKATM